MKPLILALLAASAVSLPAAAQTMESAERDIAQCLVDNDSSRVASLLRTLPGSAAERRVSKPLIQLYGIYQHLGEKDGGMRAHAPSPALAARARRAASPRSRTA